MSKFSLAMKVTICMVVYLFFSTTVFSVLGVFQTDLQYTSVNTTPYEYFTYSKMTDLFHNLRKNHSDIMSLTSVGRTYEGRDIWMVKLSDNVDMNEDEPGVLLMGAHHGNEKPSFEVLIFFIQHMIENYGKGNIDNDDDGQINEDPIDGLDNDDDGLVDEDPSEDRVRGVIDNTQIFLIPMVNPDGVEANSRKNCAPNYGSFGLKKKITSYGVNLNRNYGYDWYLYCVFPMKYHFLMNAMDFSFNYRGPRPFSENETRAVKNFVVSHDISIYLSYHSYSEVIFYPWMHASKPSPDEDLFVSIGENMSRINEYRLITGGNYIIPRYGGTLGTSENWLYGERGILSFTMELCKEFAPSDPDIVHDVCLSHVGVNLYVCERSSTIEEKMLSI